MKEKEYLHNFIVNNYELEVLQSKIDNFNPFNVLQIEGHEIRHSNVLGWLLDPNGNHNFGDFLLKKIISQIILENEELVSEKIDLLDIHLADFSDSFVQREKNNIDILLVSDRNKFVLLIENKIHAKESKYQLSKYLDSIKDTYKNHTILPVFLTKLGEEPKNNSEYAIFSHETIYKLIKDSLNLKKENLANSIIEFIEFYLTTLEKILGMNEELKTLCKKIYFEHKEALDIIYNTIKNEETSLKPAFESFVENHSGIDCLKLKEKWFWFLPKEYIELLPNRNANWEVPYPLCFWMKKSNEYIKFVIEIGPFHNGEERVRFVNFLVTKGFKFTKTAKRINSKYSRVHSDKSPKIKDWEDKEKIQETIEKLYSNNSNEIERILNSLKEYEFKTA